MYRVLLLIISVSIISCQNSGNQDASDKSSDLRKEIEAVNTDRERDFIQDPALPNVIELIAANEALGIFIEALMSAELIEQLQGSGPYTIFAPTDDAFNSLPKGTMEDLLKPGNKDELLSVLQHHIHRGVWKSNQESNSLSTLKGSYLKIRSVDNGKLVDGATILSPDLDAANGVIHVIDKVILAEEL